MSFLKKLASLFTGGGSTGGNRRSLTIFVLSHRCNEPLSADIDLLNSLSQSEDSDATYYTRKVIQSSGANRCFTQVEVELWFDGNRSLVRHEVHGGRWLTETEYAAEVTRFNTPPEEDPPPDEDKTETPPNS
jgi:hypothetical protein